MENRIILGMVALLPAFSLAILTSSFFAGLTLWGVLVCLGIIKTVE